MMGLQRTQNIIWDKLPADVFGDRIKDKFIDLVWKSLCGDRIYIKTSGKIGLDHYLDLLDISLEPNTDYFPTNIYSPQDPEVLVLRKIGTGNIVCVSKDTLEKLLIYKTIILLNNNHDFY